MNHRILRPFVIYVVPSETFYITTENGFVLRTASGQGLVFN